MLQTIDACQAQDNASSSRKLEEALGQLQRERAKKAAMERSVAEAVRAAEAARSAAKRAAEVRSLTIVAAPAEQALLGVMSPVVVCSFP